MLERNLYGIDRRSGKDRRRKAYAMGRRAYGGVERRNGAERRSKAERRAGWVRVSKWSSVYLRDLRIAKFLR
jgi:hypothetical protein